MMINMSLHINLLPWFVRKSVGGHCAMATKTIPLATDR